MTVHIPAPALFPGDQPDPRAQQFRMRRLQVHNWGTFSGLTEVPIAESTDMSSRLRAHRTRCRLTPA